MSNKTWTPVQIEVLLACYYNREGNNGLRDSQSVRSARGMLRDLGLVEPLVPTDFIWKTTPKGDALVKMLMSTPLPVERFVDPREAT
ncbi:hypothetical protein [Caldimonas sp. KR1-144]|uniref:hypothetical protein n=1 Tax=Caldimonas sp. KR1-144 TaxID=3400911 RepID=UPI003C0E80DF